MDIDFSGCVSRLLIEVNKLRPLQLSINVTAAVFYLVFVCQISSLVFSSSSADLVLFFSQGEVN